MGIVGTSTIGRIRVNLGAEETVVRAELVTKAAKSFALGRKVLVAHERTKDLEPWWYIGKIKLYGVSEACKKACPSANFLVKYTKKETGSALEGDEALELTKANYWRDEWWLLLEPSTA